jgi:hypothetical protein
MTTLLTTARDTLAALALAVIVLAFAQGLDNPLVRAIAIITDRAIDWALGR